jgi:rhodanese-related sulfurtransferase
MRTSAGRAGLVLAGALVLAGTLAWGAEGTLSAAGSLRSLANKSRTIAIDQPGKPALIVRFNEKTALVNTAQVKDLNPGENIAVEYQRDGEDNIATRISRVIPKLPQGVTDLTVAQVENLLAKAPAQGNYLLIDARPASKYAAGHLPYAVSLPLPSLEQQGAKLLPADKNLQLVFYCGGITCGLSHKSADIARKLGYTKVSVFSGGEPAWKKAEHYAIPSTSYLKDGNAVIIDLRNAKSVAAGHIPGAVQLPLAQLPSWEDRFPSTKGAPIVFYADQECDIATAVGTARDWGFTNVTGFPGGVAEWLKAGLPVQQGPAANKISYHKVLGPNEVGAAEFLKGLPQGTLLVDVRTPEEYQKERIAGAINIPTEQMAKRFSELPKGKPAVFYCNTGARAEMAFDVVKGMQLPVKFLNANVQFKENGGFEVNE